MLKIISGGKEILISDEEIKKSIDWLLNSRAKLTRVNREAKKGDVADIHFPDLLTEKFRGATGGHDQFVLGEGKFIPGFEDNIVGHKENDKFEFLINFPGDYWKEDLRNKKLILKLKSAEFLNALCRNLMMNL